MDKGADKSEEEGVDKGADEGVGKGADESEGAVAAAVAGGAAKSTTITPPCLLARRDGLVEVAAVLGLGRVAGAGLASSAAAASTGADGAPASWADTTSMVAGSSVLLPGSAAAPSLPSW